MKRTAKKINRNKTRLLLITLSLFMMLQVMSACMLFDMNRSDYPAEESAAAEDSRPYAEAPGSKAYSLPPGYAPMPTMMGLEMPEWNTEEYNYYEDNDWQLASQHPFSTFAADVDTASYSNVRRYILQNLTLPPKDAVRVEEMINYFPVQMIEPKDGEALGYTMDIGTTPWNKETKLARICVTAPAIDQENRPPAHIIFLIDTSGSMDMPNKLPLVQRAFQLLTEQLGKEDLVSIVTYAGSSNVVGEAIPGSETSRIRDLINDLMAGGGTHGSEGIETAYEIAEKHFIKGGNNRVILATDGDLNIGLTSEGDLVRLIEDKKKSGIKLSVLGFGTGNLADARMEALADHGDGDYHYIDTIYEARKVLVDELGAKMQLVAKDVKLQLEFNPAEVKAYRLIGYVNRLMDAEDFADDSKDGGEMGAGQHVTALYEIALKDSKLELPEVESRYGNQEAPEISGEDKPKEDFSGELAYLRIRYKDPEAENSKLCEMPLTKSMLQDKAESRDYILAASCAAFGLKLRESDQVEKVSYEDIRSWLHTLPEKDEQIDELIYLIVQASRFAE